MAYRIEAKGDAANLSEAIDKAEKGENGVWTITFTGLNTTDEAYNQVITLTVRTATADERAQWDLAAIKAAFPDNGRTTISVTNTDKSSNDVLAALKKAVEDVAVWGSGAQAECSFNTGANNDWDDNCNAGLYNRSMHVKVTIGNQTHEADLTVGITVGN